MNRLNTKVAWCTFSSSISQALTLSCVCVRFTAGHVKGWTWPQRNGKLLKLKAASWPDQICMFYKKKKKITGCSVDTTFRRSRSRIDWWWHHITFVFWHVSTYSMPNNRTRIPRRVRESLRSYASAWPGSACKCNPSWPRRKGSPHKGRSAAERTMNSARDAPARLPRAGCGGHLGVCEALREDWSV